MSSQKPKKSRILKVQVSFEVSRVSDECLASAYEQVIPELRLPTRKDTQRSYSPLELTKEKAEDISYSNSDDFGTG